MAGLRAKPQVANRTLSDASSQALALSGLRRGKEFDRMAVTLARSLLEEYRKKPMAERYAEYYEGIIKGWAALPEIRQSRIERLIGEAARVPSFESNIAVWKELNKAWIEKTVTLSADQKREFLNETDRCSTQEDIQKVSAAIHVIHTRATRNHKGFSPADLEGIDGLEFYGNFEGDMSEEGMFLTWFVQYQAALKQNALAKLKRGPAGNPRTRTKMPSKIARLPSRRA